MKKNVAYESPELTFVKTELFENVANECWANPSLYCLEDPTDEDECLMNGDDPYAIMNYADLKDFPTTANGCNSNMKKQVKDYLLKTYGTQTSGHYLTENDVDNIMTSGGGNLGTALHTSEWIHKVRS